MRDFLQASELAFKRARDKRATPPSTSSNYWQATVWPLPTVLLLASCKFLVLRGEAGSLQAKQSSTGRTMAADFTSCRAEPSSLLICFLQFLPQTVTPAKWIHATFLIMRPVWGHFRDLARFSNRKKEGGKTKRRMMVVIMRPEWRWATQSKEWQKSSLRFVQLPPQFTRGKVLCRLQLWPCTCWDVQSLPPPPKKNERTKAVYQQTESKRAKEEEAPVDTRGSALLVHANVIWQRRARKSFRLLWSVH